MPPTSRPPTPDDPPARQLGWALRQRREDVPATREQARDVLGYSVERIRQVEAGAYPPSVEFMARWESAYGLDAELRELWRRLRDDQAQTGAATGTRRSGRAEAARMAPDAAAVAAAAHDSVDHAATAESAVVGPVALEQLGDEVVRLARAYPSAPPLALFSELLRVRDRAWRLLERTRRPSQQRDLYLIAGQLCGLLAGTSFDLGHLAAAADQARSARAYGEIIGHAELCAWADGMLATAAFWSGRAEAAVGLVERGLAGSSKGTPRVRLLCIGARAFSHLADLDRTRGAIRAAKAARDDADGTAELHDRIGGQFGFGDARQAFCNGSALLRVGDLPAATTECTTAVALFEADPAVRRGYAARVDLAATRLHARDLDGADQALGPVFTLAPDQRAATVVTRLDDVRHLLAAPPFAGSWHAGELTGRIDGFAADTALQALPAPPG